MPEPVRLVRVPPENLMSSSPKSVLTSDRVKVMVATSPASKRVLSLLMAMVGLTKSVVLVVSKAMMTWLLVSCTVPVTLPR